jgi:hypothetical protein
MQADLIYGGWAGWAKAGGGGLVMGGGALGPIHPFQPGSPLMRLSVTTVVALLLASAKSWFPPLMP